MKRKTAKERRKALRDRQDQNAKKKDQGSSFGKSYLDTSKHENVQFFKPNDGKNSIDILPWIIKTDNYVGGMEAGFEDYVLDIWVHYGIGTNEDAFLCLKNTLGKPCPICEEMKNLKDDEDVDESIIEGLKPKRRCIYNIIDLKHEDKGVQLWDVSHFLFEKELLEEAETSDGETITFSDLENGKTIQFRTTEESRPGRRGKTITYKKFKSFTFRDRDPYQEDILDETFPLDEMLVIPTYEEVKKALLGEENESSEDENGKDRKRKKRGTNNRRKNEDDEKNEDDRNEDEIDDNEDDEDEQKSKRESGKSGVKGKTTQEKEDDDNDDDEEDEEEEEKKVPWKKKEKERGIKRGSRKSKKEEDEEEDEKEEPAPKKKGMQRKKKEKKEEECPSGFTFGEDCDQNDECADCELYDKCADALEEMEGKE